MNVVLPAPLGPMSPTLSPRVSTVEKSRTSGGLPGHAKVRFSASTTFTPVRPASASCMATLPCRVRRSARSARIFFSASSRAPERLRCAPGLRRDHASSCASFLSKAACWVSSASMTSSLRTR